MGMGKHIALVPMESLTLDRNKGTFVLSCTTEDLEALALRGGEWSVLESDEWLTRGRNRFAGTSNTRRDQGAASTWGA
jgi:hypothetical protein